MQGKVFINTVVLTPEPDILTEARYSDSQDCEESHSRFRKALTDNAHEKSVE
jgi:hypothetical protein